MQACHTLAGLAYPLAGLSHKPIATFAADSAYSCNPITASKNRLELELKAKALLLNPTCKTVAPMLTAMPTPIPPINQTQWALALMPLELNNKPNRNLHAEIPTSVDTSHSGQTTNLYPNDCRGDERSSPTRSRPLSFCLQAGLLEEAVTQRDALEHKVSGRVRGRPKV